MRERSWRTFSASCHRPADPIDSKGDRMEAWRRILADSIVKPKDLADRLGGGWKEIEAIVGDYPMRITPTVMATIKEKGDAIWKQVVPDIAEMDDFEAEDDHRG